MTEAERLRRIPTIPSYILDSYEAFPARPAKLAVIRHGLVVVPEQPAKPADIRKGVKIWIGHRGVKYWFDEKEADRWVKWIERFCCLVDDKIGEPIVLMDWHKELIRELFGWRRCDNNKRRYRRLFLMVPRKAAKTLLIACIMLGLISIDGEKNAQAYISAAEEKQAKIMFSMAVDQVNHFKANKPEYGDLFEVKAPERDQIGGAIQFRGNGGANFLRPLTKGIKGKHGFNVHAYGIDEWHEIDKPEIEAALRTGTIARSQPLGIYTTTAGNRINTPAHRAYLRYRKVKLGLIPQDNALVVIYEADKDDPIDLVENYDGAIETLKKLHPGWGITINEQSVNDVIEESLGDPVKEAEIKQYLFNRWSTAGDAMIQLHDWEKLREDYTEEDLLGKDCIGGLDCAQVLDTNSFVLLFPEHVVIKEKVIKLDDGTEETVQEIDTLCRTLSYFWCPEKTERTMSRQGYPYEQWVADGHMIRTDGNGTNMNKIRDDILALRKKFNILEIGFDPREAYQLTAELEAKGLMMTEVNQHRSNVSAPTKILQTMVLRAMIRHNNNSVYTTHMTNAICTVRDRKYLLQKPSEADNIDGAAATVTAIHRLITRPKPKVLLKPKLWGA
jgi:phage terminase large subunit-like protein